MVKLMVPIMALFAIMLDFSFEEEYFMIQTDIGALDQD